MRVFSLRTVLCLTLAALTTSTAFAGVRGKSAKTPEAAPAGRRIAQTDSDYTGVNSRSVPHPADANVTNERVIHERVVNPAPAVTTDSKAIDPNIAPAAPRANVFYTPTPTLMVPPEMAQPVVQMQAPMTFMIGPSCSTCGGGGYTGLSPAAAVAYDQTFGPGLYRSGAEAGQLHYPYYSYRRPWYFPGQPSFHRSTDYVW